MPIITAQGPAIGSQSARPASTGGAGLSRVAFDLPLRLILPLFAVLAAVIAPATAGASTLAYQCGDSICVVDPDAGGSPRPLCGTGRLAGLTRDGSTVSWVDATGIVQAPVAGGEPRRVFTGEVVGQPAMSPDGQRYLYSFPGPDGLGGLNAVWINVVSVADGSVKDLSFCFYCATTHGWLNDRSIAAFPRSEDGARQSEICRVATNDEVPGVGPSCIEVLATDARGGIGFPSGNAAGTEIVAVLSPGERTGIRGRIVRYSPSTRAPIADVTTGTDETTPVFSVEGARVAFERAGQIVVKELASGAERVIGPGVNPSWGGTRSPSPSQGGTQPAPPSRVRVQVARTLQVRTLTGRGARVRVTCASGARVRASLQVARKTARRIGTARTIAGASGVCSRAGSARLRLKATRRAAARLGRVSSYAATLRVTVTPRGGAAMRETVALRVRR
jgi:hypothetical protein